MKYQYLTIALLVALAVLAAGCTGGGSTNATTTAPTTASGTAVPATTGAAVTTAGTAALDTLPPGLLLGVSTARQPINRDLVVTFNGGPGQGSVRAMEATVTRSDGTSETKPLEARQGAEVTFKGTTGTDTVSVRVTLTNGRTYRFYEQPVP